MINSKKKKFLWIKLNMSTAKIICIVIKVIIDAVDDFAFETSESL